MFDVCCSVQAFDKDAWSFQMSISGPGKDVKIQGRLTPCKRPLDEGLARQCDTMFEGLDSGDNGKGKGEESASSGKHEEPEVPDTLPFETVLDESTVSSLVGLA